MSDDCTVFKENEPVKQRRLLNETLLLKQSKAVKATIKEDKNMDPLLTRLLLLDKTTGAYYSVNDTYIHHLLIRYVALNRFILRGSNQ